MFNTTVSETESIAKVSKNKPDSKLTYTHSNFSIFKSSKKSFSDKDKKNIKDKNVMKKNIKKKSTENKKITEKDITEKNIDKNQKIKIEQAAEEINNDKKDSKSQD